MNLIETILSIVLFSGTAGALMDMWYQASGATAESSIVRHVDDLADEYAERVLAGTAPDAPITLKDQKGNVYVVNIVAAQTGGKWVVASSAQFSQSLYIALPQG